MDAAPIDSLMQAVHNWPFAAWLRTSPVAYPALEVVHIMGFALLFGTLWLVDMRLLGVRLFGLAQFEAGALAKAALPWTLLGFTVALLAGSLMFLSRSSEFISNPAFIIKMCLLFAAGTNAALLHSRGKLNPDNVGTRVQAALSILLWLAVIACGRWIAYL
ncbi:MAG: DUF6644 family protein [Burkholderiaceae bacterium]